MKIPWKSILLAGMSASAWAQPDLNTPKVNAPCDPGPVLVGGLPDTVASFPDSAGFVSVFDGKSLKGWWENCQTSQSSADRSLGAVWLVDTAQRALYSNQASSGAGSILMTNKSYGNYEIVFDFWSSYGNDAGLFNRAIPTGPEAGSSFQTLLDYINGGNIGGAYAEEYYGGSTPGNPVFSVFPYTMTSPEGVITVATWTSFTAARNPVSFGCPAGGCAASHWTVLWDTAGWNEVRVRFWGGLSAQDGRVKMRSWFRRLANPPVSEPHNWVPVYDDSVAVVTPANPIGLQAHGGVYWSQAGRGTWYRNIRIRPLDGNGNPVIPPIPSPPALLLPSHGAEQVSRMPVFSWAASAHALEYRLQIATDSLFAALVRDTLVKALSVSSGALAAGTRHFWRVLAINNTGAGSFTGARVFTTGTSTFIAAPQALSRDIRLRLTSDGLRGDFASPHRLVVRDAQGRELGRFGGPAGNDRVYPLPSRAGSFGILIVEAYTGEGLQRAILAPFR